MDLKAQFLRDGYVALKHLTSTGKEVLVKQIKDKFGVITDFKIFDTPNSFRNVTREVGKDKTGWAMTKSNRLDVSMDFYPRAVAITKRGGATLPYQYTDVVLSEDGKNINTIRRVWCGETSGKEIFDYANKQKLQYFPKTDSFACSRITSTKPWTSIGNVLGY